MLPFKWEGRTKPLEPRSLTHEVGVKVKGMQSHQRNFLTPDLLPQQPPPGAGLARPPILLVEGRALCDFVSHPGNTQDQQGPHLLNPSKGD